MSENRVRMLEFDDVPKEGMSPIVGSGGPSHRPTGAAGAKADSQRVKDSGWDKTHGTLGGANAGLMFAAGTKMAESGNEVRRGRREKFDAMPTVSKACEAAVTLIGAENRQHVRDIPLRELIVSKKGSLAFAMADSTDAATRWRKDVNGKVIGGYPSSTAWKHVGERLQSIGGQTRGLAAYLPYARDDVRAEIVRSEIERIETFEATLKDEKLRKFEKAKVSLGVRTIRVKEGDKIVERPELYRMASATYTPLEPQRILPILAENLPRDWKAKFDYDGEVYMLEALSQSLMEAPGFVGELFGIGMRLYGDDVRSGSLFGEGFTLREQCLNGNVLTNMKRLFSRKHIGTLTDKQIAIAFKAGVSEINMHFSDYLERWSEARKERIIESGQDPQEVFGALYDAGLIELPGGREDVVGTLLNAWNVEPDYSRTGLINALTRGVQMKIEWWNSIDVTHAAEEQAGKLLYVKNLTQRIERAVLERKENESAVEF